MGVGAERHTRGGGRDRRWGHMARVMIGYGELVVEIEGIDHLWALRCQLEIPLAHVRGAATAADLAPGWEGQVEALPATCALRAGRFTQRACSVFWGVHDPARAVAIELANECCARLVVEVDDPAAAAARINRALAGRGRRDG